MEATVTGLWLLTSSWITARSIIGYMGSCGYDYQYLGVDHEEHYFFYPLEREHNIVLVDSCGPQKLHPAIFNAMKHCYILIAWFCGPQFRLLECC